MTQSTSIASTYIANSAEELKKRVVYVILEKNLFPENDPKLIPPGYPPKMAKLKHQKRPSDVRKHFYGPPGIQTRIQVPQERV